MQTIDEKIYTVEVAWLFPPRGHWTEDAYFSLPDTNYFVELSDGELIMPPLPGEDHQYGSIELVFWLKQHVDEHNLGIVRYAPLPVRLWEGKIREPDVLFISKDHLDRVGKQAYGPPDWVAEIISPGTRRTDEVEKLAEYAQAGIPEYWLLDPENRTIRVYRLGEGSAYRLAATYGMGDVAKSETISGFEIRVAALFRG